MHATDYSTPGKRRRVTTKAINGIDQDQRLNRALWVLAEALAGRSTH